MKGTSYQDKARFDRVTQPLLVVLSGPSGAGKDAVLGLMRELGYPFEYITTVTTRPRRAGEKGDIDYHFTSAESFQEMLKHEELLEWANVYGNWYGVPRGPLKQALAKGRDVVVKVDIQGAATIKKVLPQAVFIFLMPASIEELVARLKQRHTESPFDLDLRLRTAEEETKKLSLFDYVVINKQGGIRRAVADIKAIVAAEKCRVAARRVSL